MQRPPSGLNHQPLPRLLTPARQRVDGPLVLRIADVPLYRPVTVVASASDHRGRVWSACAVFESADTVIDVARDPSVGGSYRGVDADGLLSWMAPEDGRAGRYVPVSLRGFEVRFAVEACGHPVVWTVVERVIVDAGVVVRALELGRSVSGRLFVPSVEWCRPVGVVVVGRDRTCVPDVSAGALASRGYPSASLIVGDRLLSSSRSAQSRTGRQARIDRRLAAVHRELAELLENRSNGPADGPLLTYGLDEPLTVGRMPGESRTTAIHPARKRVRTPAGAWDGVLDELRRRSVGGVRKPG